MTKGRMWVSIRRVRRRSEVLGGKMGSEGGEGEGDSSSEAGDEVRC